MKGHITRSTLAFLVLQGITQALVQTPPTVEYTCDSGEKISFEAWGSTALKSVSALEKGSTCGTQAAATDVKFNLNGGTTGSRTVGAVTLAQKDKCGTSKTGDIRTLKLVLSEQDIITSSAFVATITCDVTKPSTTIITASIASIGGTPTGSATVTIPGNPTLKVIAATAGIATAQPGSFDLGDNVKIVATVDTSGAANTALLKDCKAGATNTDTTDLVTILDSNGCGVNADLFSADAPPTKDDGTAGKYYAISPIFKVFRTAKGNTLYITTTIAVCATGDTRCALPTNCAAPSGRRRRRAAELRTPSNGTVSADVFTVTTTRRHDNRIHYDHISNCLSHVSFISVVAILSVLLVVSLAVSVFFCSKLIRQNNNSQQKEAYPNPAYKA